MLAVGLLAPLASCLPADHPWGYPKVLRMDRSGPAAVWPADFDQDGRDEWLFLRNSPPSPSNRGPTRALLFADGDGRVWEQTNYAGEILTPRVLDVWDDERPEVVVPVLRGDSIFLSVASGEGQKLFGFLLATGEPRLEPDGTLPWDPWVSGMWALDLDGDGRRELVTAISTAYARHPRGILVHAQPGGDKRGEVLVGAPMDAPLAGDFDGDGRPEVLVATSDPRHGADRGGFRDSESHLILFELTPEPRVARSRTMAAGGGPAVAWMDHDGDGTRNVIIAWGLGPLTMEVVEPATLRVLRRRTVEGRFSTPVLVDLDRDLLPEVVVSSSIRREVIVVDDDLETVRRVPLPFRVGYGYVWPDLDGDGVEEIEFRTSSGGFALVTPDLEVKSVSPHGSVTGVRRRGPGQPPELILDVDGVAHTATLEANPWYLFVRYGPAAGAVGVPLMASLLVVYVRRLRYRVRVVHAAGVEALEADGRGLMVLDGRGRIRWQGPGLEGLLGPEHEEVPDLEALEAREPSLASWCRKVLGVRPARAQSVDLTLGEGEGRRRATVRISPVVIGASRDPHWIVRLDGPAEGPDRAWPMMARRIAHSVKNPLTHMLLTVQRLQTEYRERAPAVATRLDPYADRIQDGIGQLRRLTSSFLKVVDLAEPELEEVDLAGLVTDFGERFHRQVPPDIRLRTDVPDALVAARVDREQVLVALDNLVANAVNALEAGGTITLVVTSTPGVRLEGDVEPRDYTQIEVMDTGTGLTEEVRRHAFEPGFSTAEDGSGLGLAIVEKIVADHGGRVSVESQAGVGTAFTLHLPVSGPTPPAEGLP